MNDKKIAVIHESNQWFIVVSVEKYLSEVFVNKYRKVNFLNWYFTNVKKSHVWPVEKDEIT